MPDLVATLNTLVVRALRAALPLQDRDGAFRVPPAINAYKVLYDQQIAVAMAYCLATPFAGNPFHDDDELRERLERCLLWTLAQPQLVPTDHGVEHRNLRATVTVLALAGDRLGKKAGAAVAAAHARCLPALRTLIASWRDLPAYDARTLGTGTNHAWGYLASASLLAQRAGDARALKEFSAFAHRLAAARDPLGYWTENAGPTGVYHRVSAHYLGVVAEIFPTAALRAAARDASAFTMRFSFADGTPIECFDERVQAAEPFYDAAQRLYGCTALPEHPDGAAWFAAQVARLAAAPAAPPRSLEFTHLAVDALLRHERLRAARAWQAQDGLARAVGFGTARRGAWQVAWQAMPTREWHANSFFLDRQSLFSAWHASAGRVVDGSNSKRQTEIASFAVCRDGEFPDRAASLPLGGAWRDQRGGLGTLTACYDDFTARLTFTARDARTLVLRVQTRPITKRIGALRFTLRPPFRFGERVRTAAGAAIELGMVAPPELTPPLVGWIENDAVRIAPSKPATATWPFVPFSSYRSPMHQKDPEEAWFALTVELDAAKPDAVEFAWRVR